MTSNQNNGPNTNNPELTKREFNRMSNFVTYDPKYKNSVYGASPTKSQKQLTVEKDNSEIFKTPKNSVKNSDESKIDLNSYLDDDDNISPVRSNKRSMTQLTKKPFLSVGFSPSKLAAEKKDVNYDKDNIEDDESKDNNTQENAKHIQNSPLKEPKEDIFSKLAKNERKSTFKPTNNLKPILEEKHKAALTKSSRFKETSNDKLLNNSSNSSLGKINPISSGKGLDIVNGIGPVIRKEKEKSNKSLNADLLIKQELSFESGKLNY